MPHPLTQDPRVARIAQAYTALSRDNLAVLMACYASDARFVDPFNDVQGHAAIEAIFRHMFEVLHAPRFTITAIVTEGDQAFLIWDFHFQRQAGGAPWHIHGTTHLVLDEQGHVRLHRDYWDAANELYAKWPLLGGLMRWLARQLRTRQR